jgi:hypothetical protein
MSGGTRGKSLRIPIMAGLVGAAIFATDAWVLPFLIRHSDSLALGDGERFSCVYHVPATSDRLAYSAWVNRYTGFGTAKSSLSGMPDSPYGAELLKMPRLVKIPERNGSEELDATEQFLRPTIVSGGNWGSNRQVVFRGWPFLAAYYEQENSGTIGVPPTIHGAMVLTNPYSGFESDYFIGHLPMRVIPLGLIGNALVGGALGSLAGYCWLLARRRSRIRRGLCPECAYPLPRNGQVSTGICPECGTSTGPKGPPVPV